MAGAADVAEQRNPVGGLAHVAAQLGRLARATTRAGTSGAATRAAARTHCPTRAQGWRRTRRGERRLDKIGRAPDVWDALRGEHPTQTARCLTGTWRHAKGERVTIASEASHQGRESSQTRRARSRSWASRTPTWPGWWSTTSTRRAACSGGTSTCILEDSATDDAVAAARAAKLVEQRSGRRRLRRHLQLDAAGDQGPGRRRGQDALHLSRAVRGAGVRPARSSAPARCRRSRSTR